MIYELFKTIFEIFRIELSSLRLTFERMNAHTPVNLGKIQLYIINVHPLKH